MLTKMVSPNLVMFQVLLLAISAVASEATQAVPSTIPGCPAGFVDCGTCLCVPASTCQWCPSGAGQAPVGPVGVVKPPPAGVVDGLIGWLATT